MNSCMCTGACRRGLGCLVYKRTNYSLQPDRDLIAEGYIDKMKAAIEAAPKLPDNREVRDPEALA